jgi:hypothetical protein
MSTKPSFKIHPNSNLKGGCFPSMPFSPELRRRGAWLLSAFLCSRFSDYSLAANLFSIKEVFY